MNLPEGSSAWAYIAVSALVFAVQIVITIWINHRGDERDRATRDEVVNNHEMLLRNDLDDKALRTLNITESLCGAVDGPRDDTNGEFVIVNCCITTIEQNPVELHHEVDDLRRGGNNHQWKGSSMANTAGVADHKAANTTTIPGLTMECTKPIMPLLVQLLSVVQTGLFITGISQLPLTSDQVSVAITGVIAVTANIYSWWRNNNVTEAAVQGQQFTTAIKNDTIAATQGISLPPETTGSTHGDIDAFEQALKAHADASLPDTE